MDNFKLGKVKEQLRKMDSLPAKLSGELAEVRFEDNSDEVVSTNRNRLARDGSLKILSVKQDSGSSQGWYDGVSNTRLGQISTNNTIPENKLLEQALAFVAARYLTAGSPNRERLSEEFSHSVEDQKAGITVRRIDAKKLNKYLSDLEKNSYKGEVQARVYREFKSQIVNGNVPEKFLQKEEVISYSALQKMMDVHRDRFTGAKSENFNDWSNSLTTGPLQYRRLNGVPVVQAWNIGEYISDRETRKPFMALQNYMRPHSGDQSKVPSYFVAGGFGCGGGDGSRYEDLLLYKNGIIVHAPFNGKYLESPGVIVPKETGMGFTFQQDLKPTPDIKVCTDTSISPENAAKQATKVTVLDRDSIVRLSQDRYSPDVFRREGAVLTLNDGIELSDPQRSNQKLFLIKDGRAEMSTYDDVTKIARPAKGS